MPPPWSQPADLPPSQHPPKRLVPGRFLAELVGGGGLRCRGPLWGARAEQCSSERRGLAGLALPGRALLWELVLRGSLTWTRAVSPGSYAHALDGLYRVAREGEKMRPFEQTWGGLRWGPGEGPEDVEGVRGFVQDLGGGLRDADRRLTPSLRQRV